MIRVKCKWENTETGAILHEILTFESRKDAERFIEENHRIDMHKKVPRFLKEAEFIKEPSQSNSGV